ncbi:MAG: flagellar assembly peptidoglycan hydrolase FlgJ [Colwellia sp.]
MSDDSFIRPASFDQNRATFDQARNTLELNGLNAIRQQSRTADGKEAALREAAQQFEAIFMQMLLKSMRKAQEVLESDSPFNSQTSKSYRDMHDQQLAVELSSNGALGLTDLIVRQLSPNSNNFTSKNLLRSDGNISTPINSEQLARVNQLKASILSRQPTTTEARNSFSEDKNRSNQNPIPFSNQSLPEKLLSQRNKLKNIEQKETMPLINIDSPKTFVNSLIDAAKYVEKEIGIPYKVVIAQAALETGWGKKIIQQSSGASSFNLFNIKADPKWQGNKVEKNTLEFEQGTMVHKKEPFRLYDSFNDSIKDYVSFLSSNDRYKKALDNAGNVEHFLQGIQEAGYATDPQYANKILSVLRKVTSLIENK